MQALHPQITDPDMHLKEIKQNWQKYQSECY